MKIYRINDCDWWMAESKEQAIADYRKNIEDDPDYSNPEEVEEISDEDMDRLRFVYHDVSENELVEYRQRFQSIGVEMDDRNSVSFREEFRLQTKDGAKSSLFASTEY